MSSTSAVMISLCLASSSRVGVRSSRSFSASARRARLGPLMRLTSSSSNRRRYASDSTRLERRPNARTSAVKASRSLRVASSSGTAPSSFFSSSWIFSQTTRVSWSFSSGSTLALKSSVCRRRTFNSRPKSAGKELLSIDDVKEVVVSVGSVSDRAEAGESSFLGFDFCVQELRSPPTKRAIVTVVAMASTAIRFLRRVDF